MANKMTYVDALNVAIEVVNGEAKDKLIALREFYEKRAATRKPTKIQKENVGIKALIVEALKVVGKPATVGELLATKLFDENTSNQKLTSLLTQMVKAGEAVRIADKKKAFYALPEAEAVDETAEAE